MTVNPNNAPTINPISSISIPANAPVQTINLTGITDGDGGVQNLTVTATSNNPSLIPNPSVNYTPNSATGSLSFAPVPNQLSSIPVTITVTVMDNGGTTGGGQDTTVTTFTVTVTLNHAPTLNPITSPATIPTNSGQQTIQLSGITDGDNGTQFLTVFATSNNTALIPNPTVNYTSPSATGTLTYTPVPNASGTAVDHRRREDNGGTVGGGQDTSIAQQFTVTVSSNLVNHAPSINAIPHPNPIPANSGLQTIPLTGLGIGAGDSGQTLTITASSDNTALINPTVTYINPNGSTARSPTPRQRA